MKYAVILIFLIVTACSSERKESVNNDGEKIENKSKQLLGSWKNLSMIVRMPDSMLNVTEGSWEKVLGIKPIVTTFSEDGSYISEYRTLEDSVFMTRTGAWLVENDSLTMIDGNTPNKYHFEVMGDTVVFTGYLDWDQDGTDNDHYAGKQIRLKNN